MINLGRIDVFVVHLSVGGMSLTEAPPTDPPNFPAVVCTVAGEPLQIGPGAVVHTWTRDRSRVSCRSCIEWMHA